MYLVASSSSPPLSPPPPCGDEKEEDSAEEEEADGGAAPRDLGWAGAGRDGPGTAALEPRGRGVLRSGRAHWRISVLPPRARPRPGPPHLPYLLCWVRIPLEATATGGEKKELPPPLGGRRTPPKPTPGNGAGTPGPRRDLPRIRLFLACISERIKNGRECGGTRAAFSQAA